MQNDLFSGLVGSIFGGIIAVMSSNNALKRQYENQKEHFKQEEAKKEKVALLTIDDELEENRIVLEGYLNFINTNNKNKIDFRQDNVNMVSSEAWKKLREVVFLSANKEITKKISRFYKGMYCVQNTDYLPKDLVQEMISDCISIKNDINNYTQKLL